MSLSRKVGILILSLLLLVVVGGLGNLKTQFGGVVEDPFLDNHSQSRVWNEFAQELGFEESISVAVAFVTKNNTPREFDTGDIENLIKYHEDFEDFLLKQREYIREGRVGLDADLVSIVNYNDYHIEDGTHVSSPYIWSGMSNENLDFSKSRMLEDVGVNDGIVVGNDFTFVVFTVLLYPDQKRDVIRDSLSTFLQGRPIGLFQTDIEPKVLPDTKVYPVGWPFARGWFSLMSSKNNKMLVGLGVLLLLFFFWSFTRSAWHTLVIVFCVYGFSFILLRGSIGLIDWLGIFLMRERVFTELVYGLALVISVSMGTHLWHGYISARHQGYDVEESWVKVFSGVGRVIGKAAIVAIVSFAMMALTATLRPMAEVGILFTLSVVYPWFFALVLVPVVFRFDFFTRREPGKYDKVSWVENFFAKIAKLALRWNLWVKPSFVFLIIVAVFAGAYLTYTSGRFLEASNPDRFLGGTYFEESAEFMNEVGKTGFNDFQVAFKCLTSEYGEDSYRNPDCISDISEIVKYLESTKEVRTSMSVPTGAMSHVSKELLEKEAPENMMESDDVFGGLETSALYLRTQNHFLWNEGYRVIFFSPYASPAGLGEIQDNVINASRAYAGIEAYPFGSDAMWVELSNETVISAKKNVFQDLMVLWLLPGFYLLFRWMRAGKSRILHPFKVGVIVMLPFFITSCVMVMVMALLEIPLDIASASINQMVIGAAADFLFFPLMAYIEAYERRYDHFLSIKLAFAETGIAVTGDAFFNCCAFALLMTSVFVVVKMLGILLIVAVLMTWISTMFLVLPLMSWTTKSS